MGLRKISEEELQEILHKNQLWLNDMDSGERACLIDIDLSGANLRYVDLSCANLSGAILCNADLTHANLSHANIEHADLRDAKLSHVNLEGATGAAIYGRDEIEWEKYLKKHRYVLVFDTETSGLDCDNNDILSLSWQLIDAANDFKVMQEQSCYFDWVSDDRTSQMAIEVNGLTRERLQELGTMPRTFGLEVFKALVKNANLLVAHNGNFDIRFIEATAERELAAFDFNKPMFDTMTETTDYCQLPPHPGRCGYKFPKLRELADILGIDDSDIDYHQSSADVEVTKRCFIKIAKNGICHPPQDEE